MFIAVIFWIYFAFLALAYGAGILKWLRTLLQLQNGAFLPLPVVVVFGLTVIAWLSSVLSLVLKMGWFAHLLILVGGRFLTQFSWEEIKASLRAELGEKHWVYWAMIVLGGIVTILYAVKPPSNLDTPLYHGQAIHWIEAFPAVPGLANLDPRLGSNSNWFILNAVFSFSFLKLQSFHLVPSFLFLVCLFYFWSGFQNILRGDLRVSQLTKVAFIPFSFYVLIDEISSPGTDLPVILIYWTILCLWMEAIEEKKIGSLRQAVVFFLSVFVITYKLSGFLILLIGFWILLNVLRKKEYRSLGIYIGFAGALLLPWLIRNFVLSGYWLYPEPLMQTFSPDVDWRVPVGKVGYFKTSIQAWAISPALKPNHLASLSLSERLGMWFGRLSVNRQIALALALCSPLLFLVLSFVSHPVKEGKTLLAYGIVILVGLLNLLFWLFSAPNFRFGYGFVIGMIVLALASFLMLVFRKFSTHQVYLMMVLVLILSLQQVTVILNAGRDGTQYFDYLVFPAPYAHLPSIPCDLGNSNRTILCAQNLRLCGYDAFPCVPQAPKNVEMRGNTVRDGFRWILSE